VSITLCWIVEQEVPQKSEGKKPRVPTSTVHETSVYSLRVHSKPISLLLSLLLVYVDWTGSE